VISKERRERQEGVRKGEIVQPKERGKKGVRKGEGEIVQSKEREKRGRYSQTKREGQKNG
jgi:hypothetical protein